MVEPFLSDLSSPFGFLILKVVSGPFELFELKRKFGKFGPLVKRNFFALFKELEVGFVQKGLGLVHRKDG